jgi:hypothetical protein
MSGDSGRSRSKRGLSARIPAITVSSVAELRSGRWNSMPWAPASSSMATIPAVFSAIRCSRKAAPVAMLTWSSWFAEVGRLSTLAG